LLLFVHKKKTFFCKSPAVAPPEFIRVQLNGIIGFRLRIARLERKWKLSQNRPEADRAGVNSGLRELGGAADTAIAGQVAKNRANDPG